MSDFDVDREPILFFPVDDAYFFKHYFERNDVFEELSEFYVQDEYRFEVPAEAFEAVSEVLREAYYEPTVVEEMEEYCVVKERFEEYAPILRNAVVHWQRDGYNFFLLKDDLSVKAAIEKGATPIAETEFVMGI